MPRLELGRRQRAQFLIPRRKWLVYTDNEPETSWDIWVLSLEGEREARPFPSTADVEAGGALSPDGRWIAYDSDESGRLEVYVRPFPGPGGKWQVSISLGLGLFLAKGFPSSRGEASPRPW